MSTPLLVFRIIVEKPVGGLLYGLQSGSGNQYETIQPQLTDSGDLTFAFSLPVKTGKDGRLALSGPIAQGPPTGRFLYLDIGSYAGQANAPASGRLKVPLPDITANIVQTVQQGGWLQTRVPGTRDKDGSAYMGSVKPAGGWVIQQQY